MLFGMWPAFLLTAGAVVLGSAVVFWLARVLGHSFAGRFVSQKVSDKYLDLIRRKRDIFLVLVFLFPVFPDDLICILAGLRWAARSSPSPSGPWPLSVWPDWPCSWCP